MTDRSWQEANPAVGVYVDEGALREEFAALTDPEPRWPRIHLFRFPRRELVLLAGAVGSAVLLERYGLSWSEGTLAAVPLVGGWVVSEVIA